MIAQSLPNCQVSLHDSPIASRSTPSYFIPSRSRVSTTCIRAGVTTVTVTATPSGAISSRGSGVGDAGDGVCNATFGDGLQQVEDARLPPAIGVLLGRLPSHQLRVGQPPEIALGLI